MNEGHTVFLLGAGASKEAGLFLADELTGEIGKMLQNLYRDGIRKFSGDELRSSYHRVWGELVASESAKGGRPGAVNVEQLFAALQFLCEPEANVASPFVATWKDSFKAPFINYDDLHFQMSKSIKMAFETNFHAVGHAVGGAIDQWLERRESREVFIELRMGILEGLATVLSTKDRDFAHLSPIVEWPGPRTVVTLNYDWGLESAADEAGVSWSTGAQGWTGSFEWNWPETANLRILKLHGSVGWHLSAEDDDRRFGLDRITVTNPFENPSVAVRGEPALIFGAGNKMRSQGPYTAMLVEFERLLADASHLVVVGYSFGDEHVNEVLRRWCRDHADSRIAIIDPGLPDFRAGNHTDFRSQLQAKMRTVQSRGGRTPRVLRDGCNELRKPAGEGLDDLARAARARIE